MARRMTAETALARIMELCEEDTDSDSDTSETNESISDADNASNLDSESTSEREEEDRTEEPENNVQDHIEACIDDVLQRKQLFEGKRCTLLYLQ